MNANIGRTAYFLCALTALTISVESGSANTINIFGLNHTSLGNALLQTSNGAVSVTNIGSSGNDGVRIDLPPNLIEWREEHLPLPDINTLPIGATFTQTARGTVEGVSNQAISVLKQTHVFDPVLGDEVSFEVDFPLARNFPDASVTGEYFLAGQSILTERGISPHAFLTDVGGRTGLPSFGISGDITGKQCKFLIFLCKTYDVSGDNPRVFNFFTPFEANVLTDVFDLTLEAPDLPFISYTDVSLMASGIPAFTITSEEFHFQAPEPASMLLFATGLAILAVHRWSRAPGRWFRRPPLRKL